MKIVEPSFQIETPIHGEHGVAILKAIERAARTCYKSECKITDESFREFVSKIIHVKKHESVIEHQSITVRFIVDRGVSHEIVRHRLAAFSQESTRYCNYSGDKFGGEITVIDIASGFSYDLTKENDRLKYAEWTLAMDDAERHYNRMISLGASPQEARSVLPNSLKTELVMTCNLREWRHVLNLRTSTAAHPQMRQVMVPLLDEFNKHLPEVFGNP